MSGGMLKWIVSEMIKAGFEGASAALFATSIITGNQSFLTPLKARQSTAREF